MKIEALSKPNCKSQDDGGKGDERGQALVAWSTAISVLLAAPRLEQGLLMGAMVCSHLSYDATVVPLRLCFVSCC